MALHPKIAEILAGFPAPEPGPLHPDAMRAAEEAQVPPLDDRIPVAEVRDAEADGVPVRIYRDVADADGADADGADSDGADAGVIVYVHGGAFFLGSLDTHDHVARSLAVETGMTVVSVGYRRAPEAAFPAGLDDVLTVTRWADAHRSDLGQAAGEHGTLALVGDSSGGTFVAAAVALLRDAGFDGVTHQVLYYPSLDLDFDETRYPSLVENAVGFGLETAGLAPFNAFYLDSGADPADPRVSPIKRDDLAGLPPALILTAEHDPLRDEGERYGERLREAGVPVRVTRYEGAGHGFVQHFGWLPEYHRAFVETAEFLRGAPA